MISQADKIRILSESVANRIAAGEIIERPSAVVKELIDNSLDAESSQVTIEVEDGGRRLIAVADDGEGMSALDARLACRRFATSKLQTEEDLFGIQTFGFRGEALPSIAAVARFQLVTSRSGDEVGTCLRIEGGEVLEEKPFAAASGTRIEVRDLFYNTPARRKFLKSSSTEFSHICHVVQQAALVRYRTHFRLRHNGRLIAEYPAVPARSDRLLQVLGQQFLHESLSVNLVSPHLHIEGVTVNPHHTRTSKVPQELFVNSRAVKNATISHAIYEAYASFLPKSRHPVYAIFLDMDPTRVDVNVHPTKREVKFAQPDVIHQAMKEAVRGSLHPKTVARHQGPESSLPEPVSFLLSGSSLRQPVSSRAGDEQDRTQETITVPETVLTDQEYSKDSLFRQRSDEWVKEAARPYAGRMEPKVWVLGQIHYTYLVAQIGPQLHIIDQHTVHERVLFERLWKGWREKLVPQQPLLIPEPIDLPPHTSVIVQEHLEDLRALGLEVEPFGASSFVVRAVPAILGVVDYRALLLDLIEDLAEWKTLSSLEHKVHPLLASMACQGAVQAGRPMDPIEGKRVIEEWVMEGFPMTCPHGRRIAMRFSMDELNRIFGRGS